MSTLLRRVLRVVLLVAAVWALRRELDGVGVAELVSQLSAYGWRHAAIGLACTVASFLVLGVIEVMAIRASDDASPTGVSRRTALLTAFVAHALSQSVGLSLLTGAAVRLRAYARSHLDAADVARVTGFVTLTTTLGLLASGAVALLASSDPLRVHGITLRVQPVGAVLALLVVAYLAWSALGRGATVGRGRWRLARPSLPVASAQVGLSAMDWMLTGTVLFAFIPTALGIGYWPLLRAYMLAQMVGTTSHVPGGAGVLEVVLLALVGGSVSAAGRAGVVASLVMFRIVYYLVPLVVALAVAGVTELRGAVRLRPVAAERARVG